jgi:hypothetical protein
MSMDATTKDDLDTQMAATAEWLAQARADGVGRGDAVRGMAVARGPRLTAAQRRRARALVEETGCSRQEAVAAALEDAGR